MNIKGRFDHFNINVTDLERSIKFYETALGLHEFSPQTGGRRFFCPGLYDRRLQRISAGADLAA